MPDALAAVENLDPADQDRVRRVYESGFPAHELATWESLVSEREPSEEALVFTVDGEPAGFVHLRSFITTDRVFLRYLVVDGERRGQGLGSRAWQRLRDHCVRLDASLLVWDVEHPDVDGLDEQERSTRKRRIAFYERLGGVVLPVDDYTTPDVSESGSTVEHPMLLMATALDGEPSGLPVDDRAWVDGVVADVQKHRWNR